jgi:hypothetical protein
MPKQKWIAAIENNSTLNKWITPIWSNPIGWARKVGQSRVKVIIWIFIHIAFVAFGLWAIYSFTRRLQNGDLSNEIFKNQLNQLDILTLLVGAMPIIFIGVLYPAFYLYVIYRLLQEIDKRDKVIGQSKSV